MGKTHRQASIWYELHFKYGDTMFPEDNVDFFNGRYQAKMRNQSCSYMCNKLDPRSMKVSSWADSGKWAKAAAKRCARHAAKILVNQETLTIMREIQEEWRELWFSQDWHDEAYYGFDFSMSDEAYDYAEMRCQEELDAMSYEDIYYEDQYDPWDYDFDY